MGNSIRQYTEWEDEGKQLVTVRQFTRNDEATYDTQNNPRPEQRAQLGTWVVEAKYDGGLSSLLINLEDIVREALLHNPGMVANVVRDHNARRALGDSPDMNA